jgi:1,4-dihydroxy-2-naphthoate octaprenyltransferase
MPEAQDRPGILKTWFIAVRPFAYSASVLSVALGLSIAYYRGAEIRWGLLVVTLVGVVLFHTAANLLNDCFDFRRGLDTEVNPGSGAVVRGLLSSRQVFAGAMVCLALGAACGLYLWWQAGWVVLLLGLIGTGIALTYTTAGLCFKFTGLGDLAIFVAFGVLPVFGTFWVQLGKFDWLPIIWSVPLAFYTVGILHANNWRDNRTDPTKGCRTIASLLGDGGSAVYYRVLVLGPHAMLLAYVGLGFVPALGVRSPLAALAGLLALPLAFRLIRHSGNKYAEADEARMSFITLDAQTAQVHTAFGALLTVAFFVGRHLHL